MGGVLERFPTLFPAIVTDAGADFDGKPIDMDGACYGLDEQPREAFLVPGGEAERNDDKLVAAKTIDAISISIAQMRFATSISRASPPLWPTRSTDLLEAVEVDREDRNILLPLGVFDVGLRPSRNKVALECVTVGKFGKVIVCCRPVGLGLGAGSQFHLFARVEDAQIE